MIRIYSMFHPPFIQFGLGFWFMNRGNGDIRVLNIHLLFLCLEISWIIKEK